MLAARASGVRRGASSARVMRAYRYARRWSVRTVTGAALAGACVAASLVVPAESARAEGRAPATSPIHPSQVPPPGMSLPGFHAPAVSNGTVSSGSVRVQPARMPFYVATKGKVTLYVLGTLHTGDPSDYPSVQPFRPRILAALAASPTLALELSPDDLLESQDDVSKYGVCRYPCLQRLLPEPLWQRLAAPARQPGGARRNPQDAAVARGARRRDLRFAVGRPADGIRHRGAAAERVPEEKGGRVIGARRSPNRCARSPG